MLLDTAGEQFRLAATATSLRLETSETFSGLTSGTDTVTFGPEYTNVRVTDAAAGTTVTFEDRGTSVYAQGIEVALSHGCGRVTFDGTSDFGDNRLAVSADSGITVSPGAVVRTGVAAITLDGNDTAGTETGDFIGVDVEGNVTTVDGDVRIAGRGGDAAAGWRYGWWSGPERWCRPAARESSP